MAVWIFFHHYNVQLIFMKRLFSLFSIVLVLLLCRCSEDRRLRRAMIGEWQSETLSIVLHTANQADTTILIDVNSRNWIKQLGIKPIKTIYYEDGRYLTEYRDSNDIVIQATKGIWTVRNDSLFLTPDSDKDSVVVYGYRVNMKPNKLSAKFTTTLDFDDDGQVDDDYFSTQHKISSGQ